MHQPYKINMEKTKNKKQNKTKKKTNKQTATYDHFHMILGEIV